MQIKLLLATGINCKLFEKRVIEVIKAKGVYADIERIDYRPDVLKYGVFYTPALVINEKVVSSGRLLSTDEISRLIH